MDADLQDPPEELLPFILKIREGWDVVYAIRTKRKEGIVKKNLLSGLLSRSEAAGRAGYPAGRRRLLRPCGQGRSSHSRSSPNATDLCAGLRSWVGFRQTGLAYERQARFTGESKYTFRKLFKLALDGIFNFSYRPLQFIMSLGFVLAVLCFAGAGFVVFQYVADLTIAGFNPRAARGWTSLIFTILFLSSVNLICLGIVGEYIGRLFEEVKRRPTWIVGKRLNLPKVLVRRGVLVKTRVQERP